MMSAFIVVNLRGTINQRSTVKTTMEHLHLESRFRATIIPNNKWMPYSGKPGVNHLAYEVENVNIVREKLISAPSDFPIQFNCIVFTF